MGGVFGINKHIYSYYRFATDKVVASSSPDYMGGIIITKNEAQLLINNYLQDPNNNQLYTFYLLIGYTLELSKVGIYQCFVDIPSLYMNEENVGFVLNPAISSDVNNFKIASLKILDSTNFSGIAGGIDFVEGYSEETFIGGIWVSFN